MRQGHDVTLFASGNSKTAANLVPVCEPATSRPEDETSSSPLYAAAGAGPASYDEFDVLRFHIDLLHAPMVAAFARRTVTTLLGRRDLPELQPFCRVFSELLIVCIFNDQRRPMPSVNWARAIWSVPDFSEDYAV